MELDAPYDELGPLYDVWCAEVDEDIPFYVALARALARETRTDRLRVAELGAGSGRITLPLARAGHDVLAIDSSAPQLDVLADRLRRDDAPRGDVTVFHDDIGALAEHAPAGSLDLVVAPFRVLLHATERRRELLGMVARLLRPGGVVAFDVFHPTAEQVADTHDRWVHRRSARTRTGCWRFDERARYASVPSSLQGEPDPLRLDVDVRARWSARRGGGELPDPEPDEPRERRALLHLHVVPPQAWLEAIEQAGLEVDGAYGWFDGRPLEPGDDDSVWVARRPR